MIGSETKELYHHLLTDNGASNRMCCQVLKNIQNYLLEEEEKMIKADHEWRKNATKEDLKEMGDLQSGYVYIAFLEVTELFFFKETRLNVKYTA
jgi:cohesin loading factor subunit SCC2